MIVRPSRASPLLRPSPGRDSSFWRNITVNIDAFIIGAPKCATKWIAQGLRNSKDVNIPGECQGLTQFADHDASYYNDFFSGQIHMSSCVTVDYSNTYCIDPSLPSKIQDTFGKVPIVFCFRDPVRRAFSHYLMDLTYGYFRLDPCDEFRNAILSPRTFSYFDLGLYGKNLWPFLDVFGSDSVMVVDADGLNKDPRGALQKILRFIGSDEALIRPAEEDVSTWNQFQHQYSGKTTSLNVKPSMKDRDKEWLWEFYRHDHEQFLRQVDGLPNVVGR